MSQQWKCDVCGYEGDDVCAGRWIFYCPEHKQNDRDMTYENEIAPDLENDIALSVCDGELTEIIESMF